MSVTQGSHPHVTQADEALARAVHKVVAVGWMELGSCNHFCKLFHVGWLDVNNVKALVRDIQMPQVDAQVVGG